MQVIYIPLYFCNWSKVSISDYLHCLQGHPPDYPYLLYVLCIRLCPQVIYLCQKMAASAPLCGAQKEKHIFLQNNSCYRQKMYYNGTVIDKDRKVMVKK